MWTVCCTPKHFFPPRKRTRKWGPCWKTFRLNKPLRQDQSGLSKKEKPKYLSPTHERKFVSFIFIQSHIISGDLNEASNSYAQYSLLTRHHTCHLHRYRCSSKLIKKTFSPWAIQVCQLSYQFSRIFGSRALKCRVHVNKGKPLLSNQFLVITFWLQSFLKTSLQTLPSMFNNSHGNGFLPSFNGNIQDILVSLIHWHKLFWFGKQVFQDFCVATFGCHVKRCVLDKREWFP